MLRAVTIDFPVPDQKCPWSQIVSGIAIHHRGVVQTMVLAADNRWYPQPRVKKRHGIYIGTVYLGFENHPNAKMYTIAVGVGGPFITEVVDNLPCETLWTKVQVERIP
jgi:hypothetical protein